MDAVPVRPPKVLAQVRPLSQGVPGDGPAVLPIGLLGFDLFSHVSAGKRIKYQGATNLANSR